MISWVPAANDPDTDFPLENLPFGVFERDDARPSIGIGIGDRILDLRRCGEAGLLDRLDQSIADVCADRSLNRLMALGRAAARDLRDLAQQLLVVESPLARADAVQPCLVRMQDVRLRLPADIGDYTDFYASIHHASNVGALFRPDRPLPTNYRHLPLAYHGRSSSIVPSGTAITRPAGQWAVDGVPRFAPTLALDFEMEVGFFVGHGNELGAPIAIDDAEEALFGVCLVNDWSARDLQAWESQPLGPFLSKDFATTISPWVVPLDALDPFRLPAVTAEPEPLPYLRSEAGRARGAIDIVLDVSLATAAMRDAGLAPVRLGRSLFRDQYWTAAQLVAHHTSNGCNLRAGDLLASGTVSGTSDDAHGCLLELTRRGRSPLRLPNGEERRYLEDGDEVIMRAFCERDGHRRIGFGECRGRIAPR